MLLCDACFLGGDVATETFIRGGEGVRIVYGFDTALNSRFDC